MHAASPFTRRSSRARCALLGALIAACATTATVSAEPDQAGATVPGAWQAHQFLFQYLSSNSTYSCGGLADKLRLLLSSAGARDAQVNPLCVGNPGLPDRLAQAQMRFQTLTPIVSPAATGVDTSRPGTAGAWRRVHWTFHNPKDLGMGDCSLIEQVVRNVLPMFATRAVHTKYDCAQYHDYGAFDVSFEVFAPAPSL